MLGWVLFLSDQRLGGFRSPGTSSVRVPHLTAYEALAGLAWVNGQCDRVIPLAPAPCWTGIVLGVGCWAATSKIHAWGRAVVGLLFCSTGPPTACTSALLYICMFVRLASQQESRRKCGACSLCLVEVQRMLVVCCLGWTTSPGNLKCVTGGCLLACLCSLPSLPSFGQSSFAWPSLFAFPCIPLFTVTQFVDMDTLSARARVCQGFLTCLGSCNWIWPLSQSQFTNLPNSPLPLVKNGGNNIRVRSSSPYMSDNLT